MDKLLRCLRSSMQWCAHGMAHLIGLVAWLAAKLWDWGAVLFITAGLWAFGGIGIGAAVAEPIPSAVEIAEAGMLIWLSGLLLLLRILHSAWKTAELTSRFQSVVATAIGIVLFAGLTQLGGNYLTSKVPLLSIDPSVAVPHLSSPPFESSVAALPPAPGHLLIPSLDAFISDTGDAWIFVNKGASNIYLWGAQVSDADAPMNGAISKPPVTITPNGGSYHVYTPEIAEKIKALTPGGIDLRTKLFAFVTMDDKKQRVLDYGVWIHGDQKSLKIDTQNHGVTFKRFIQP